MPRETRRMQQRLPYWLLAPGVVLVGVVLIYPLVANLFLSFWEWSFGDFSTLRFVGFDHYIKLFTSDPFFWRSLRFTILFTIVTMAIEIAVGVAIATLIHSLRRGKAVVMSVVLLPYVAASLSVGLVWSILFSETSPLAYALELLGIGPIYWFAEAGPAFWSVVIAEVWRSMPFVILIITAALAAIPADLLEAARVDGAGAWRTFTRVTMPLLRPALTVVVVFLLVYKLRLFDLVVAMTSGGPANSTVPLGLLLQQEYFLYQHTGKAAAIGVVLLVLGAATTAVVFKLVYRRVHY